MEERKVAKRKLSFKKSRPFSMNSYNWKTRHWNKKNRRAAGNEGQPSTTLVRPVGMADKLMVKCTYLDHYNSGATNAFSKVYRCNSLFDPDFAVGGATANYLTEYGNFYNSYRVHGCEVHVSVGVGGGTIGGFIAHAFSDDDPSAISYLNICEQRYGKMDGFAPSSATGGAHVVFHDYISIKKLNGLKSLENQEDLEALTTANPVDTNFFCVKGIPEDGVGGTAIFWNMEVKMIFYAEFFNPKIVV